MVKVVDDPCFPQIAKAVDKDIMRVCLQAALFSSVDDNNDPIVIVSCEIKNLRHKPGKSCLLSYQLGLLNTRTALRRNQLVSVSLCKFDEDFQAAVDEEANNPVKTPTAELYIAGLALWVRVFPHDRKLVHLGKMLDSAFIRPHLTSILPKLGCSDASRIRNVQVDILQYLPERSCMVRYRLYIDDPIKPAHDYAVIYGKNYRDDSGEAVYSVMQQLAGQLPATALPLAYDAASRTLWQSHVSGISLEWRDLETAKGSGLLENMAACIAAFQCCRLTTTTCYGFSEIDEQLLATVNATEVHDRLFAGQISRWVTDLIAKRTRMPWPETALRPLHQDLHLCNFMVNGNELCLIDFDTVCLGDPLSDIGSLIANFYRCGLYAGRQVSHVDSLVNSFLGHYRKALAADIDLPRLHWFIAAALVHEVIRRILRQRQEGGLKHLQTYLDLSKRYAGPAVEVVGV